MRRRSRETSIRTPEQATDFLSCFGDLACRIVANDDSIRLVDRFLWDYVGDAELYSPQFVPLRRNIFAAGKNHERVFGKRMVNGVTESGILVHARQADGEMTGVPSLDYFVATANIFNGDITEWRVNNQRHNQMSGLELTITTDVMDVHGGEGSIQASDPLIRRAQEAEARYERKQADSRQARLFVGAHGARFKEFAGMPEDLGPLRDLTDQLSEMRGRLPELRALGVLGCGQVEQPPNSFASGY